MAEGPTVYERAVDDLYRASRKSVTVGSETQFTLGAKLTVAGAITGNVSVGPQALLSVGPKVDLHLSAVFRKHQGPVYEFANVGSFAKYNTRVESVETMVKREVKKGQEEIIQTLRQDIEKYDQVVQRFTSEITELRQKIGLFEAKIGRVGVEVDQDAIVKVNGGFILSAAGTGQNESKLPLEIDMRNSVELSHGENSLRVDRQGVKIKRGFSAGIRNLVVEE